MSCDMFFGPAGRAVAQPDLSHCGGISEVWRVAALAECFDGPSLAPVNG